MSSMTGFDLLDNWFD